jgi:hypothetical protein
MAPTGSSKAPVRKEGLSLSSYSNLESMSCMEKTAEASMGPSRVVFARNTGTNAPAWRLGVKMVRVCVRAKLWWKQRIA